jgi:hypothetical protein
VVQCHAPALRTTFTVLEFTRLLTSMPLSRRALPAELVARAHELVRIVRGYRGMIPLLSERELDIPDPVDQGIGIHSDAAHLMADAIRTFVSFLCPSDGTNSIEGGTRRCCGAWHETALFAPPYRCRH